MGKPHTTIFFNQPNAYLYRLNFVYPVELRKHPIESWFRTFADETGPDELQIDNKPVTLPWRHLGGSFYVENVHYLDIVVKEHAHLWVQYLSDYIGDCLDKINVPIPEGGIKFRWNVCRYDALPTLTASGSVLLQE